MSKNRTEKQIATALVVATMHTLREPCFYRTGLLADSFDGRYRFLQLLLALLINHLNHLNHLGTRRKLAQHVLEAVVDEIDGTYREMGVGDMRFSKTMRKSAAILLDGIKRFQIAIDDIVAEGKKPGDERVQMQWRTIFVLHLIDPNAGQQDIKTAKTQGMSSINPKVDSALTLWREHVWQWYQSMVVIPDSVLNTWSSDTELFPAIALWTTSQQEPRS